MNSLSIKQIVEDVINGEESGLKAFAKLKTFLKDVEDCVKAVEPYALEEAEKYEKTFSVDGFIFEKRQGGKRWNFKNIPEWSEAKANLTAIEDRAKATFSAYQHKLNVADDDGEIPTLPEVTYSKDSLIVKGSNNG